MGDIPLVSIESIPACSTSLSSRIIQNEEITRTMITRKKTLTVVIFILTIVPCLVAQKLSKDQREILELQDDRSLGDGILVSYLQNRDKDLRYRAAVALGNLQDTSTISALAPLLLDPDVQVRAAAAFALGQIGSLPAEKLLVSALTADQDIQVLPRVFEALGKCGDSDALNAVIAYIPAAKNIAVKRDQALSIARFAMRKITSERGVWLCFDLLKDNHSETRSAALYALWRSAPLGVIDVEISNRAYVLVKLMSDKEAEIRINLASLLGKTKSDEAPRLIRMFQQVESQSPDWRVQVQLARSVGALAGSDPGLVEILLSYLASTNDHVKITSLITLASTDTSITLSPSYKDRLHTILRSLATTPSKGAILVQGEAIVTLGRLFPGDCSSMGTVVAKTGAENLIRAKYIEALSYHPTEDNIAYVVRCLHDDSVRVAMAAWDFLKRMMQPKVLTAQKIPTSSIDSIPTLLVGSMGGALERKDLAITTLVADMFADTSVFEMCKRAGYGKEIVNDLMSSYSKLLSSEDAEAMLAIQRTFASLQDTATVPILQKSLADSNHAVALGAAQVLAKLTGGRYTAMAPIPPPPVRSDEDWKALESIKSFQRITFRTTKGVFTIRLLKEDAPFTVLAILRLVKKGFYNGLTFHRVVPDFVIQGGDPRGDGWGGAGFTLRSEWSLTNFERGSVGMASSGKDTEGCQFFITHIPAPHLDGRYTLFASVISGMEVVDRIQVGDRILKTEIR
jgi:cyclophilin family peptidyl-prolyl cis-trans isomerase/HEAT repeat protein